MEERLELVGAAAESSYDGKLAMRGLPLSSAPIPWQKSWWEASAMPPPSKTTKSRSPPILTAGGLFHTACDTHTDKGICCSEPAPPACLTLAAVQTRARKAGRVRSERPLSGMVLFPHSRASGASASLVDSAARRGWLRQEKGAKSGAKGRPGSSHGTIFFFPRFGRKGESADSKTSAPLVVVRRQHCGFAPFDRRSGRRNLNSCSRRTPGAAGVTSRTSCCLAASRRGEAGGASTGNGRS